MVCTAVALMSLLLVMAQGLTFSQPHGFCDAPFALAITPDGVGGQVRYTLDGSEPTAGSLAYTEPLNVTGNTVIRAAVFADGVQVTDIQTATYLFVDDVLQQTAAPEGYPMEWGAYTTITGVATADYGMDPDMTQDPLLAAKISEGLMSLPVLSIVTDRNHLFSHENDSVSGGIYIFTGPPVGDATGHGWTRPVNIELMGGPQQHDLNVTCGLRLHGGHGRLAEKNPKHSFRLVFKQQYGPKTLKYPLFGPDEPAKFDQLVLRCHFGNSWQHWMESNRQKAQYTRDVWARRMQRKLGHTSVNALYVHLFLNGMYWGLYNIAERVDDQFGKDHLGGKKSDIDVVKIEEEGGNHVEASEGDLTAWQMMVETAANAADDDFYQQLDTLLDIDNFIDYMLINQYAGNTDWDHHNWYAIRRRGTDSQGFRFLCWDTEMIFDNARENVLGKNNGAGYPTGIFQNLLQNNDFAIRYKQRAKELLADDGPLGSASVVSLWDSLYNTITTALYDEAARWGDYRRDVHPYTSQGPLYTVDDTYQTERNRLLTQYFPVRSEYVLDNILRLVDVDDFVAPDGWEKLTASMFHEWDGTDADAQPLDKAVSVDWNMNQTVGGGTAVAGFVNVEHNRYADLSDYEKLVLRGTGSGLRILANRLVPHGPWKQVKVSFNSSDPYWDEALEAIVLPLDDLRTIPTNEGVTRNDDFVHLNVLKVDWSASLCVRSAYLVPRQENAVPVIAEENRMNDGKFYNLNGQQVIRPTRGIYIHNGKRIFVK